MNQKRKSVLNKIARDVQGLAKKTPPEVVQEMQRRLDEKRQALPVGASNQQPVDPKPPCRNIHCHAGTVDVLDPDGRWGLRVPCDKRHFRIRVIGKRKSSKVPVSCAEVGCRGWTPNPADWPYVQAAWGIDAVRLSIKSKIVDWLDDSRGRDPGPACLDAVWEALKGERP